MERHPQEFNLAEPPATAYREANSSFLDSQVHAETVIDTNQTQTEAERIKALAEYRAQLAAQQKELDEADAIVVRNAERDAQRAKRQYDRDHQEAIKTSLDLKTLEAKEEGERRAQARREARGERVEEYNDAAQLRIFGSGNRPVVDPNTGETLPPIVGKLEQMRDLGHSKHGNRNHEAAQAQANAEADAYLAKIRFLTEGPSKLSLAQAELITDGELEDQAMARAMAADLQALGKSEAEAARIAAKYAERQTQLRNQAVKEEAIYTKDQLETTGTQRLLDRTVNRVNTAIKDDREELATRKLKERELTDARDQDKIDIIAMTKSLVDAGEDPIKARRIAERAMQRKEDARFDTKESRLREVAIKTLMGGGAMNAEGKRGPRMSRAEAEAKYDAENPAKPAGPARESLTFLESYKPEKVSYLTDEATPEPPRPRPAPKRPVVVPPAEEAPDTTPKPPTPPPAPTPEPVTPPTSAEDIDLDLDDGTGSAPVAPPAPRPRRESDIDVDLDAPAPAEGSSFDWGDIEPPIRRRDPEVRKSAKEIALEKMGRADEAILDADHKDVLAALALIAKGNDAMRAVKWNERDFNAKNDARRQGGLGARDAKKLDALLRKLSNENPDIDDGSGVLTSVGEFLHSRYSENGMYRDTKEALSGNSYKLIEAVLTGRSKGVEKYAAKVREEGANGKKKVSNTVSDIYGNELPDDKAQTLIDRFTRRRTDAYTESEPTRKVETTRRRAGRGAMVLAGILHPVDTFDRRRTERAASSGDMARDRLAALAREEDDDDDLETTTVRVPEVLDTDELALRAAARIRAAGARRAATPFPFYSEAPSTEAPAASATDTALPLPPRAPLATGEAARFSTSETVPIPARPVSPAPGSPEAPATGADPIATAETAEIPGIIGERFVPMLTGREYNALTTEERDKYDEQTSEFYRTNPTRLKMIEDRVEAMPIRFLQQNASMYRGFLPADSPALKTLDRRLGEGRRPLPETEDADIDPARAI